VILRPEQSDAFESRRRDQFARNILASVRAQRPQCLEGIPQDEQHRRALRGIDRARPRAFLQESSIALFVNVMFLVGPGFEREPECAAVLDDPALKPDDAMRRLLSDFVVIPWDAIEKRCRLNPW
jgi:hypothetical protein